MKIVQLSPLFLGDIIVYSNRCGTLWAEELPRPDGSGLLASASMHYSLGAVLQAAAWRRPRHAQKNESNSYGYLNLKLVTESNFDRKLWQETKIIKIIGTNWEDWSLSFTNMKKKLVLYIIFHSEGISYCIHRMETGVDIWTKGRSTRCILSCRKQCKYRLKSFQSIVSCSYY